MTAADLSLTKIHPKTILRPNSRWKTGIQPTRRHILRHNNELNGSSSSIDINIR